MADDEDMFDEGAESVPREVYSTTLLMIECMLFLSMCYSQDQPMFFISWNDDAVQRFLNVANKNTDVTTKHPNWMQVGSPITVDVFKHALITTIRPASCMYVFGNTVLGPVSITGIMELATRIRDVEHDPWIQECMHLMGRHQGLCTCAISVRGQPPTKWMRHSVPFPLHKVFE